MPVAREKPSDSICEASTIGVPAWVLIAPAPTFSEFHRTPSA